MRLTIELESGKGVTPTKRDIDKNIEALTRYIHGNQFGTDGTSLIDTRSILTGIREQLPD